MKSNVILILYCIIFFLPNSAKGQYSITYPLICHDKDNYLKCYNDGAYKLTFANGNFKEFTTLDNSLKYSEPSKEITFFHKNFYFDSVIIDTVQIILLPKSILLKKDTSSLEILSMKKLPEEMSKYGVGTYSIDRVVRGLAFWCGDRYVELEILDYYDNVWSWNIKMEDSKRLFAIQYNVYKNNRVEYIFIKDDSLRYGIDISMTFKTAKKVWHLQSSYVDTLRTLQNGTPVIGAIPLDHNYWYEYDKSGRLNTKKIIGELKLCDCN